MPEFLSPGVFVEEVSFRARAISGVSTSAAVLIGAAERGPAGQPVRLGSFAAFQRKFGDGTPLSTAVRGFFDNGGAVAYVIRTRSDRGLSGKDLAQAGDLPGAGLIAAPGMTAADDHARLAAFAAAHPPLFALLDADPDASARDLAATLSPNMHVLDHGEAAAIHAPWLTRGGTRIAPSGHVAGRMAMIDAARGPNATATGPLAGADGVAWRMNAAEADLLNEAHVNAVRVIDGNVALWGGRTMSSDPEWKYVPIRRYYLFLETSLQRGLSWAVFEPNDAPLWSEIRAVATDFMLREWRGGAVLGAKPEDAFFVKCGAETTTQADIDRGIVNLEIGFAPIRPAEFVIFRIGQKTADT